MLFFMRMRCVNENIDESGQIRLLILEAHSSRKIKELGTGFFIEIVVLDVD